MAIITKPSVLLTWALVNGQQELVLKSVPLGFIDPDASP